jgi:hypothetical protein
MDTRGFAATGAAFDELDGLFRLLNSDMVRAITLFTDDPDDAFARRNVVRHTYSYLEGVAYALKRISLKFEQDSGREIFTSKEREQLSETKIVDKRGFSVEEASFLPIETNLKVAFKAFSKAYQLDFSLDTKSEGWNSLWKLRASNARNRITHPKNTADLSITVGEVADASAVAFWFTGECNKLICLMVEIQTERKERSAATQQKNTGIPGIHTPTSSPW